MATPSVYGSMSTALAAVTGARVWVVQATAVDWGLAVWQTGWSRLLRKVHAAVTLARGTPGQGQIVLVGHSAGGLLARLYLAPRPLPDCPCRGADVVGHVITLGTPHVNRGGVTRGGKLSRFVEASYPGSYFGARVTYTSVVGELHRSYRSSPRGWLAGAMYSEIGGSSEAAGDGLIPVRSALLAGSRQIILRDVSHHAVVGSEWYGSPAVIPRWWSAAHGDAPIAGSPILA